MGIIESNLSSEDESFISKIKQLLDKILFNSTHLTNSFSISDLSSDLMRLSGYIKAKSTTMPTVFVGHSFSDDDKQIVEKFLQLFKVEGLQCTTGEKPEANNVDEKVMRLIDECQGVIIIFTRDQKIEGGNWTTHSWLIDEKSFSLGKNKTVILFYEDIIDQKQKIGIQGDLEYVEFKRQFVEESFTKAIQYIKSFKGKIV